jgi:outer membrane beta-barrel protein
VVAALALAASPAFAQKGKKGGGAKAPAPTPAPAPSGGGDAGGEIEMDSNAPADSKPASDGSAPASDGSEIDMGTEPEAGPGDLNADIAKSDAANAAAVKAGPVAKTKLSWQDIVVVVRKPFLKAHRTELMPMFGTTMNDNMVRHYAVGGSISYFLTDVLAIGVEGFYYQPTFREPFDLVARQARRLPTVNTYNWSGALDFHYVPVYGKFAILDKKLVTWEVQFTAGIGAGQSEVEPRDKKFPGFTNLLIEPNLGASMRFFLAKWLTVNIGVRDYVFLDKFEPVNRAEGMNDTAAEAKDNADTKLINNVMFQIGLSFWVPTGFEYTTFR